MESIRREYDESGDEIANPERGFYAGLDLLSPGAAGAIAESGLTLGLAMVRLDEHRDRPLPDELFADLEDGLQRVREGGLKVIARFAYDLAGGEDAPLDRVLEHIDQLAPLLQSNADVIATLQAGFIGAWGEWHTSSHGLDAEAPRREILLALLEALPPSRSVQVRTPMYKEAALPGGPLAPSEAFDGSARSRVGHHDDALLADATDMGTYGEPVERWREYLARDSRYTPVGGESCVPAGKRGGCETVLAELAAHHWSYLNSEYHPVVLARWVREGCEPELRRRLGYRLTLRHSTHSARVAPGGELALELELENLGFAAPFNERPVYLVLHRGSERRAARLDADPRRWLPGAPIGIATRLRVPADLEPGAHSLSLWLPDAAGSLRSDPRYAVRLANDGLWDPGSGENALGTVEIDPSAPAPEGGAATKFVEIE